MKRVVILVLMLVLSMNVLADIVADRDSFFDSIDALGISSEAVFSSSLISSLSDDSDDDDYYAVKKRYEYFDNLLAEGKEIKAKEIFSEDGLKQLALNEEDIIEMDKVKSGILLSSYDRAVALVPSDIRFTDLSTRAIR